ncbi:hypothetical protein [Nocardia altamirensis]|uniref:hypothetical protein n=1 Tax=Nocardia altamirensis TaxID=472158 RepID=UPI00083FE504|nr:hypothetical protein [Nocardia altamirensis]
MNSDITSQTIEFGEPDEEAEVIKDMRHVWRQGCRTADSAAADLRAVAQKLTELRTLPTPAVPYADPAEWWEHPHLPGLPFTLDTVDQIFGTLIGHVQLIALRYEEESRDLNQALTDLDKALETPAESHE